MPFLQYPGYMTCIWQTMSSLKSSFLFFIGLRGRTKTSRLQQYYEAGDFFYLSSSASSWRDCQLFVITPGQPRSQLSGEAVWQESSWLLGRNGRCGEGRDWTIRYVLFVVLRRLWLAINKVGHFLLSLHLRSSLLSIWERFSSPWYRLFENLSIFHKLRMGIDAALGG